MKIIIRLIKSAKQWRWQLVIATVTLLLITGINLAAPYLIRILLKELTGVSDSSGIPNIAWILAGVLLGLYIIRILFQFMNNYFAHIAAWNAVANMRARLYNHMQSLSMKFFSEKQTGQLMSRAIEDTANFEALIAHSLPDLISSVFVFVGVLVIMFIISPIIALLSCIPIPLIFIGTICLKKVRKYFTERQRISAELSTVLHDNLAGIKEIQIFNRQKYEYEAVKDKAQKHADQTMKGIYWISILHPLISFLSGLGTLIVVFFGGILAVKGFDVADITTFLLYLGLLYAPVTTLSRILEEIQNALVSGKRVFEILDTESEIKDSPNAKIMPIAKGEVEFKDVKFEYGNDIAVLKGISFKAEAGKMVALVGSTGAGKSTIAALLARFYDAQSGEITIDGTNILNYTLPSLRDQLSMVLQDVFLFNGTIAQNIAYGKDGIATEEEIINAGMAACIHDFVMTLPDKYNTVIGERGVRLSGGQKQRLAIARAILRKAPILILDEATSAVDNETETQIQKAINALAGTSTILVIAHRLSTVERADEILVLDGGVIVERGTHSELLKQGGMYYKMYKTV